VTGLRCSKWPSPSWCRGKIYVETLLHNRRKNEAKLAAEARKAVQPGAKLNPSVSSRFRAGVLWHQATVLTVQSSQTRTHASTPLWLPELAPQCCAGDTPGAVCNSSLRDTVVPAAHVSNWNGMQAAAQPAGEAAKTPATRSDTDIAAGVKKGDAKAVSLQQHGATQLQVGVTSGDPWLEMKQVVELALMDAKGVGGPHAWFPRETRVPMRFQRSRCVLEKPRMVLLIFFVCSRNNLLLSAMHVVSPVELDLVNCHDQHQHQ
jgi:hypothetical protein